MKIMRLKYFKLFAWLCGAIVFYLTLLIADRIVWSLPELRNKIGFSKNAKLNKSLEKYVIPLEAYNFENHNPLIRKLKSTPITGNTSNQINVGDKDRFQMSHYTQARHKILSDTGDTIFNVNYSFDQLGRRIVPAEKNESLGIKNDEIGILFLGCSFVFGSGVEDTETSSFYLSQFFKKNKVWNLGMGGAGPNDHYFEMTEKAPARYEFPFKKIILIYGFIPSHLNRMSCSSRCFGRDQDFLVKPHYVIEKNQVRRSGTHADFYGNSFLKSIFSSFNLIKEGYIEYPIVNSKENISKYNFLLNEIKKKLNEKYEIIDAYQVYLGRPDFNLINLFSETEPSLNYKPIIIPMQQLYNTYEMSYFSIPIDNHPTPLANYLVAESIKYQLVKDHPQLFKATLK